MIHAIYIYFIINAYLAGWIPRYEWKNKWSVAENIILSMLVGLPTLIALAIYYWIKESEGKYISLMRFLINFYISERNKPKDEVDWDTLKGLYRQSVLKNQKLEVWKLSKVFKRYNIQP